MEIKPCPFCGQTPEVSKSGDFNIDMWIIKCPCDANIGYYYDKKIMIDAWNTRDNSQVMR
jgi:Lar family restriction alleviation protein